MAGSLVRIERSGVIPAPAASVWRLLRDFNAHALWHPAVDASAIEDGDAADVVGAVRAFRLAGGGHLREQLIALSDRERSLTYCLLEAPVPLYDYVATMQVLPVTASEEALVVWRARFAPPAAQEAALIHMVQADIYETGLRALADRFAAV
ncbi:SRPBCC family protein [Acidisphaera rubrifaciens]|uniref:Polyketide cyclase/dehydrase n=1 Tax=Acidisphaera rubrifaciens HS-AP3 TaxID=1231350 RepID=A0A0D6P629_9PROT|nr:SRPBCC family protein [Acidisphaera rubrifaciens]GAN76801.1 polyketide cyclase/dehydrase [Acidisphaera rubrifaciens HS-AP3]